MPHSVLFLNFFPNWPQSSYCCELSEHCGFISLLKPDIFLYSGHQNGQRFYHASSSDIYFENLHMWWELTYKLHVHSYIARIPYFHVELGWLIPPPSSSTLPSLMSRNEPRIFQSTPCWLSILDTFIYFIFGVIICFGGISLIGTLCDAFYKRDEHYNLLLK